MMEKIWISLIGEGGRFLMAPNGAHSVRAWVKSINLNFHGYSSSKTAVVGWFGNNGNFVLSSSITNVSEITDFFCSCTGYNAVLLNLSHIYWLIQKICLVPDLEHKKASLWDKGAGFQLKGTKRYFDEFHVDENRIQCIERGVAGVNRIIHPEPDLPISGRKVRPKWLKISKGLRTKLDGEWTARSLPMLNGVFERALLFLSKE
jgi:hypothetical protein